MTISRRNLFRYGLLGGGALALGGLGWRQWRRTRTHATGHIVIIGAGMAGVSIANYLSLRLAGVRITVVGDRRHVWDASTSGLYLAGNMRGAQHAYRDVPQLLAQRFDWQTPVTFRFARVRSIDSGNGRVVLTGGEDFAADAVVVACGIQSRDDGPFDGVDNSVPIVRLSGGAAGIEHAAKQLARYAASGKRGVFVRPSGTIAGEHILPEAALCHRYFAQRAQQDNSLTLISAAPFVHGTAAFDMPLRILLSSRDITTRVDTTVLSIDDEARELHTAHQSGAMHTVPFDFLCSVPKAVPSALIAESGLAVVSGTQAGYFDAAPTSMHRTFAGTFALGDSIASSVIKSAHRIEQQVSVCGDNVIAYLQGRTPQAAITDARSYVDMAVRSDAALLRAFTSDGLPSSDEWTLIAGKVPDYKQWLAKSYVLPGVLRWMLHGIV